MNIEYLKEHKTKTLLSFAIPSIIAMLLQTVITVTDGFFTGNYVGESALAAINLGLPVLYFYLGVGLCIGVGGSVICGKLLGAGDRKKACEIFSQTHITALTVSIVASLLFAILFTPLLKVLHADGELCGYFTEYYRIMLFAYPLMIISTILGMFVRADGKPQFCMIVSVIGCVLNAVFDYIMVVKLKIGIRGSAIATLIVQIVSVVLQFTYFFGKDRNIRFCKFKFDKNVNRETIFNGSSEFIGEMASAISMFAFNYVLMKYVGTEGVVAFTVLGFAVYGYSMIAIGFGQGLTTPVSILWGAEEKRTAVELRKITNKILFCIGFVFAVCFLVFSRKYAGMFGCSNEVVDMISTGFRFFTVTFLIMGYDVINSMYFTGCGDAKSSAIISSLRGIVFLLIFAFIFPALWGMNGVWLVTPTTETLTAIISFMLIRKQGTAIRKG